MSLLGMYAKEETESEMRYVIHMFIAALITANLGINRDVHQ